MRHIPRPGHAEVPSEEQSSSETFFTSLAAEGKAR